MSQIKTSKMTNWRWWICGLLFVATTVNYLDRQVLSLTAKEFIYPDFHWTDKDYGDITAYFSIFYAICMLFAGKFVDWMGTKKGYLWAIGIWSLGACLHAGTAVATQYIEGIESIAAMQTLKDGSTAALAVASTGVWLFLACRAILGLGEAGNFPAAIKVTAEYFPKKDRSFATSVFNAGASVGALAAPLIIPPLAKNFGWEMSFIIIGVLGFIWMGFYVAWYDKPEKSSHVNKAELLYINQDEEFDAVDSKDAVEEKDEKQMSYLQAFGYKQTWAFIVGKFFTDGVWWFFLFWAPGYFQDVYGYKASSGTGMLLIMTLYAIVTFLSIYICKLPTYFVEKRGMNPYAGRMLAMMLIAFVPLVCIMAQPMGEYSAWWPAIIIGLVGAGHQAWSANLFSTIGDMFPKKAIATITGIGGMAGGIGSYLINKGAGSMFSSFAGKFSLLVPGEKESQVFEISKDKITKAWTELTFPGDARTSVDALSAKAQELGATITDQGEILFNNETMRLSADNVGKLWEATQYTEGAMLHTSDLVAKAEQLGGTITDAPTVLFGLEGKPGAYMIVFCICAVAYLLAWVIMKTLVPKYKPVVID